MAQHQRPTQRGLIATPLGSVHYCMMGSPALLTARAERSSNNNATTHKLPLLAFHMSPRSFDEFLDHSLPPDQLVIAFDELGYGYSDNPTRSCSIDELSDNIMYCVDYLDIEDFYVTGSLIGCYFCLSLASRHPDRVRGLILTNLYYWPDNVRKQMEKMTVLREKSRGADPWDIQDDGSHIASLWDQRSAWLHAELNTRVVRDELLSLLKRNERFRNDIHIQDAPTYDLESAIRSVEAPVLCIQGVGATQFFDANGYNMTKQFEIALSLFCDPPRVVKIDHPGSINIVNQNSYEWSRAVEIFLAEISSEESESSAESE
jgi:pimeloyl-ACP methyl ester carboxylesterase